MTLRIQLAIKSSATIISDPTLAPEEEQNYSFYSDLDKVLSTIPTKDKIILLGDFSARVSKDSDICRAAIGKDGVGKVNSSGILLCSKCAEHWLSITNTMFRQRNNRKTTWQHPHSKQWHLSVYVIVRSRDLRDAHLTCAIKGTEACWTDHHLVKSVLSIRMAPKHQRRAKTISRKYNTHRLLTTDVSDAFERQLSEGLDRCNPENDASSTEEDWEALKKAIHKTCEDTIGFSTHHNQDWFNKNDTEMNALLDRKWKAYCDWQNHPSSKLKQTKYLKLKMDCIKTQAQRQIREMEKQLVDRKGEGNSMLCRSP